MSPQERKRAVVLFSGGLDSTTVLACALRDGFSVCALSFNYGQRHAAELEAAQRLCRLMKVERHETLSIDLTVFGGSALTSSLAVPKGRSPGEMSQGIPVTYVPARNTIFLSFALAWAEVLGSSDIFIGVNALDYSGYPDCRPEFIRAFQQLADVATRAGVEGSQKLTIHTPLINLTKAQIIRTGLALGVNFAETSSCYDPTPGGLACGECDACLLRKKGFAEAEAPDPTRYASKLATSR
ncbi:MAG: 7-cyano-7-deazaguanine synthase QueC [Acidobacteriota bacterium]|nr:7-cyano-7-deazaguanine synthase QueC [Acidobacteriota bacterium]